MLLLCAYPLSSGFSFPYMIWPLLPMWPCFLLVSLSSSPWTLDWLAHSISFNTPGMPGTAPSQGPGVPSFWNTFPGIYMAHSIPVLDLCSEVTLSARTPQLLSIKCTPTSYFQFNCLSSLSPCPQYINSMRAGVFSVLLTAVSLTLSRCSVNIC